MRVRDHATALGWLRYYLAAGGSIRAERNGMSNTETEPTDQAISTRNV
jgi:hypothetical protein